MSANPIDTMSPGWPVAAIDLHQHLWPDAAGRPAARPLAGAVPARLDPAHRRARRRTRSTPAHHDVAARARPRTRGRRDRPGVPLPLGAARASSRCSGPSAPAPARRLARGCRRAAGRASRAWASVRPPASPTSTACGARLADGLRRRAGARPPTSGRRRAGQRSRPVLDVAERGRASPVLVHPGPEAAGARRGRAAGVVASRSSGTPRSSRPPGGPGTPPTVRGVAPDAADRLRRRRGARAGAPRAATPRGAGARGPSTRSSTSTPRRTALRASTPWSACSASTRSCSAATGRTPSRSVSSSATPPPAPFASTNPRRVARPAGHRAGGGAVMAASELTIERSDQVAASRRWTTEPCRGR